MAYKVEGGNDFILGIFIGILLSMAIIQTLIFSAYYEPENFGDTYKDIFCSNLK